jgi:hypothetical protein
LRSSLNNFHEPSAEMSRILSRVRDPFLKLQIKGHIYTYIVGPRFNGPDLTDKKFDVFN